MTRTKYDFIVYVEFTNPYSRLVLVANGKVWDVANDELALGTTWGDTDIQLAFDAVIGGIPITMPTNLPEGNYDFLLYDAAAPASGDDVQIGKRVRWTKQGLLGIPIDL